MEWYEPIWKGTESINVYGRYGMVCGVKGMEENRGVWKVGNGVNWQEMTGKGLVIGFEIGWDPYY